MKVKDLDACQKIDVLKLSTNEWKRVKTFCSLLEVFMFFFPHKVNYDDLF